MDTKTNNYIESIYEYKDELFKIKGTKKTQTTQEVAKALNLHLFGEFRDVTSIEDCMLAIERYIESKNIPSLKVKNGVDESLLAQGRSNRMSLFGIMQIPNQIEKDLCSKIYSAQDGNGTETFFLKHNDKYELIGDKDNLDIAKAYSNIGLFETTHYEFESLLLELGNKVKDAYNNNNAEEELTKLGKFEIPTCLLTEFENYIITITQKLPDADVVVAKSIQWGKNSSNPTFAEYFEAVIKKYSTLVIKKLDKFPNVYGNIGTEAMNIFDIEPYKANKDVKLNEAWEEMESKYTENEWKVLTAWIWSILEAKNKGRQAMFIIDYQGFSGKSVLIDFLTQTLSPKVVAALSLNSMKGNFGFAKVWDKRLVAIGDNKNSQIARTEWFHNVLGGDYVDVEYKGQSSFTAKMNAKLIVCSNNSIEIDPKLLHERTRTIILQPHVSDKLRDKMTAKDKDGNIIVDGQGNRKLLGDPTYLPRLIDGTTNFLSLCYKNYQELCPTHSEIILPDDVLETLYDIEPSTNLDMDYYINQFVEITNNDMDYVKSEDFHRRYMEMINLPKNNKIKNNNNFYSNMVEYLKKNHDKNCSRRTIKGLSTRVNAWLGIKLKLVGEEEGPIVTNHKQEQAKKDERKTIVGFE